MQHVPSALTAKNRNMYGSGFKSCIIQTWQIQGMMMIIDLYGVRSMHLSIKRDDDDDDDN